MKLRDLAVFFQVRRHVLFAPNLRRIYTVHECTLGSVPRKPADIPVVDNAFNRYNHTMIRSFPTINPEFDRRDGKLRSSETILDRDNGPTTTS
jgi:hypothetical protein